MAEMLTSELVLSAIVQMPFVLVMGIIMLGMRQDLRDLRQDLRECISGQQELLTSLVDRVTAAKR